MGRIKKGITCSIEDCSEPAIKSVPLGDISLTGPKVSITGGVYLCKSHYKEFKKKVKRKKVWEKWRWGL